MLQLMNKMELFKDTVQEYPDLQPNNEDTVPPKVSSV
jgi:hypothetical protein